MIESINDLLLGMGIGAAIAGAAILLLSFRYDMAEDPFWPEETPDHDTRIDHGACRGFGGPIDPESIL